MALRKYIFGLFIFAVMLAGLYFLAIRELATGYVDKYYPKFTQEAGSLIVGLSRAQYGLVPSVIAESFPDNALPVVNFAFELYQSPYGEILYEDIKNKIKLGTRKGNFVLEVSPASFLTPLAITDDKVYELDSETLLGKMTKVATQPNYEYLRKCYGSALYKGIYRMKPFGNITVHDDGWVAFSRKFEFYTVTDQMAADWKQQTLDTYIKVISQQRKSESRIKSFIKIIKLLQQYGKVYVVRMPISNNVKVFEDTYWKDFSKKMQDISNQELVPFLDYSYKASDYNFYDGSHLFAKSANLFTAKLSADMLQAEKRVYSEE